MTAVEHELRGRTALLTLNRPEVRNAVDADLSTALGEALDRAVADGARAVVLTGAGASFCAGADLKAIAAGQDIGAREHPEWGFAGFVQHWVPVPVIAAVNGPAMGGGTELVLASDLAVASEAASFGLPEVRRGLYAAAGGVVRLPRQVPLKRALELGLTGEAVDAATALEWGLVNRVVPPEQLLEEALALADRIAANAPTAVRETKRMMHLSAAAGSDWDPAWDGLDPWRANLEAVATVFGHPDAVEGPTAFAEKREPRWRD